MNLRVPPLPAPTRLDHALVLAGGARTRSQAKLWLDADRVRVDGATRKASHLVRGGETIVVDAPSEPPALPEAEDLPLAILFEDEWLVAIDKPAGMVVHPAPGAWHGTVVNALLHRGLVDESAPIDERRPGIVHRLDKETSGVLLVARRPEAHLALAKAFQERRIHKRYLAIVLGWPARDDGVITWSIGRHAHDRHRMSVRSPRARAATSRWRVRERFANLSLVEVEPETGRTHQIRVHLAALGHPVLADPVYGKRSGRAYPTEGPGRELSRQALHAAAIEFDHPITGRRLEIAAPLPPDLVELLGRLRG